MEQMLQILVLGRFKGHKKADIEARLRCNGHTVVRSVAQAELVLAGSGRSRALEDAEQRGLTILDASALDQLAPHSGSPAEPLPDTVQPIVPPSQRAEVVRQIAAGPHRDHSWWLLCERMKALPPEQIPGLVEDIAPHVLQWPTHERIARDAWLAAWLDGGDPDPRLRLAGNLSLKSIIESRSVEDAARVLDHRHALLPNVRQLRINHLRGGGETLLALLRGADVSDLTEFDFMYCDMGPEILASLLDTLPCDRVTVLDLRANALGTEGARAIADAGLASLRWLQLYQNDIKDAGAEALCGEQALPALRRLVLAYNHLSAKSCAHIAQAPFAHTITDLVLDYNDLLSRGAKALAEAPLTSLEALSVSANEIGNAGLKALLRAPALGGLRSFSCFGNGQDPLITVVGAKAIAGSRAWPDLENLDLSRNAISAEGLEALMASPHRSALRGLDVTNNRISADVLAVFARDDLPVRLRRLRITVSDGDKRAFFKVLPRMVALDGLEELFFSPPFAVRGDRRVVEGLLANPHLAGLRSLETWYIPFSDLSVRQLIDMPFWRLEKLNLSSPKLSDTHIRQLAQAPWLERLEYLVVSGNKTSGDVAPLQTRLEGAPTVLVAY